MLTRNDSSFSSDSPEANGLSADQLWTSYFASRSLDDRNRLVLYYAPLVRVVANRVARRMRSFQSLQELCSCGQFGLIDAIEKFDASGGFQFSTYATIRIQGAIFDEMRRDDILPKRMRARVHTYQVARESLEAGLRRAPSYSEVAAYLNTTVAEVVELDDLATTSSYLVPLSATGDGIGALLATTRPDPSESANLAVMRDTIRAALLRITERQRQVLVLHFLEGFQKSEIADVLSIDRSRVTQLIHQGLRNLRNELGETPL